MQEETIEEKVFAEECCGGGPKVEVELVHEVSGAGQPVIVQAVEEEEEEE